MTTLAYEMFIEHSILTLINSANDSVFDYRI